eukprot:gnl/TRDRNA2_/TRDRNA2_68378_c0_seq1.p1 gnl/TRDRNA2_/TRDRNA2_68378_c0~~gnl/TRDRNA2_/TRDRNA2_68378_c0_seq1.p1  ORF type:complete len:128 (-),score=0.28 gnl/TRDRNA2_/TRDRNA2_68378_c0_seq1:130-513(-)
MPCRVGPTRHGMSTGRAVKFIAIRERQEAKRGQANSFVPITSAVIAVGHEVFVNICCREMPSPEHILCVLGFVNGVWVYSSVSRTRQQLWSIPFRKHYWSVACSSREYKQNRNFVKRHPAAQYFGIL